MKFTELNLDRNLLKGLADIGYSDLMPVQEATLKHSLKGHDVAVQSQTGTGKTAAFLVTIFQRFQNDKTNQNKKALIITPTRELAVQIEREAKLIGGHLNHLIGSIYGGIGYKHQEILLKKGMDMIIGTPGRLLDFNAQKKLSFKDIGFFVIDEADRMLDMGFFPDIKKILKRSSASSKRQTMLFSATLDDKTKELARRFSREAISVEVCPQEVTVAKATQMLYHVNSKEKINLLLGILKKEAPRNALIFTNMKTESALVAAHLQSNGYKCCHLNGDLAQKKRLRIMEKFKSGSIPILVATDVAARGLHIDDLELIINYDLPGDCENYVHRIGRTARAGKSGKAITFACDKHIYNLEAIESLIHMKIPVVFAEEDMFLANSSADLDFKVKGKSKYKSRNDERVARNKNSKRTERSTYHKRGNRKNIKGKENKKLRKQKSQLNPHKGSIEDRLAFYEKKYGDHFNIQP